ncbi:hypothetical protein H3146_17790 [Streptomyces sp. OF3]|uniref:DUF3558 domain-containing protein n=1 Tax=Streptomyces alkaliterrae TaxID=2213162 RepID=A0A7W3ZP32_9ACTN|nr:hypothetical protein [Streptomyces alkaliterrae]MBB1255190.1 hypothetical protein [Streptomyces alkaliterrae]
MVAVVAAVAVLGGGVFAGVQLLGGRDKDGDNASSARPGDSPPPGGAGSGGGEDGAGDAEKAKVDTTTRPRALTVDQLCAMVPEKLRKGLVPADARHRNTGGRSPWRGTEQTNLECSWIKYLGDDRGLAVKVWASDPDEAAGKSSLDFAKEKFAEDRKRREDVLERHRKGELSSGLKRDMSELTERSDVGDEAFFQSYALSGKRWGHLVTRANLWFVTVEYRSADSVKKDTGGALEVARVVAAELAKDKGDSGGSGTTAKEGACRYVSAKSVGTLVRNPGTPTPGTHGGSVAQENCRWPGGRAARTPGGPREKHPSGGLRIHTVTYPTDGEFQYDRRRKAADRRALRDPDCQPPKSLSGVGRKAFVQHCTHIRELPGEFGQGGTATVTATVLVGDDTYIEVEFRGNNAGGGVPGAADYREPHYDPATGDPALKAITKEIADNFAKAKAEAKKD